MRGSIKNMFKDIDWSKVFLSLMVLLLIGWITFIIIWAIQNEPPQHSADTLRKIKICRTYSNDFWRNDIDFIDSKCYYKGKEVEIK